MKKIVVPTDFSESSLNALRVAAKIAGKTGAQICLVSFYEKAVYGFVDLHADNEGNRKKRKQIQRQMRRIVLQDFMENIEVHEFAAADKKLWEITDSSKLSDADLVVVGKYGGESALEWLTGSDRDKLIRLAKCPVLTIDKEAEGFDINNMVFASDFGPDAKSGVSRIVYFANEMGACVHLLKIVHEKDETALAGHKAQVTKFATDAGFNDFKVHLRDSKKIDGAIIDFTKETSSDMIAMETYGKHGLANIFHTSIAERVVHSAETPMLTVKMQYSGKAS